MNKLSKIKTEPLSMQVVTRYMSLPDAIEVWQVLYSWSPTMNVANMLMQDMRMQGRGSNLTEVLVPSVPIRELFPRVSHPDIGYWLSLMITGMSDSIIDNILSGIRRDGLLCNERAVNLLEYSKAVRDMKAEVVA